MSYRKFKAFSFLLLAVFLFLFSVTRSPQTRENEVVLYGDLILHPALLSLLYGGDRFLAANIEATRATTSGRLQDDASLEFFAHLHENISRLNPCHEDNYYIANAFLTWGGAPAHARETLVRAADCRFWDAWPSFLLGFNLYSFAHDSAGAAVRMEEAASRAAGREATLFSTLAISLRVADYDDLGAAINYLQAEQARTQDVSLKKALAKRVLRLQGLAQLREAQREYERRFSQPLLAPKNLLSMKVLSEFPTDPLGIGYEFRSGNFELRQLEQGRR